MRGHQEKSLVPHVFRDSGHDIGAENCSIHKQGIADRVRCKDEGQGNRCAQGIPYACRRAKPHDLEVRNIGGQDMQGNGCITYVQGFKV
jgi:hypothetical protein